MRNVRILGIGLVLVLALNMGAAVPLRAGSVESTSAYLPAVSAVRQEATPTPMADAAPATVADLQGLQVALQDIYDEVGPSVVSLQVSVPQTQPEIPFEWPFPQAPDTPQLQLGLGSGFVWDEDGHIVTNNHVVAGAQEIGVVFTSGTVVSATVVGRDPDSDLAVIRVEPEGLDLQPVEVADSTQVVVGQLVAAIGQPFGLEGTMTFGIVSAVGRTLPVQVESIQPGAPVYTIPDIIQTDAPVNPGNSGGVLLDMDGRLIGVPSAIESPVRASAGLGFAIPSVIVQRVVPALIEDGFVEHPWLGVSGTALTPPIAEAMGLDDVRQGALVVQVVDGSPADEAELQGSDEQATIFGQQVPIGGDVIVEADGEEIGNFADLTTYLIRNTEVGQTIELTIVRDEERMSVPVTLEARPTVQPQEEQQVVAPEAYLGINVAQLTPDVAEAMGLTVDQQGVLVRSVVDGGPADEAGLQGSTRVASIEGQRIPVGGDVIVEAGGESIETTEDLLSVVSEAEPGDELSLTVLRDGESVDVSVTLGQRPQ